jgi:hypothetical protein
MTRVKVWRRGEAVAELSLDEAARLVGISLPWLDFVLFWSKSPGVWQTADGWRLEEVREPR